VLAFLLTAVVMATGPGVYADQTQLRMAASVNEYRDRHGLPPMRLDPILMQVAARRCSAYSHCQGGKWMWDACHEAGFHGWASDDIASGYETPEECVEGWATSDGHARQMRGQFRMNGRWENYHFDRLGVAYNMRNKTWIAVFGHLND
jgi:uncharacterized protein YkwD